MLKLTKVYVIKKGFQMEAFFYVSFERKIILQQLQI